MILKWKQRRRWWRRRRRRELDCNWKFFNFLFCAHIEKRTKKHRVSERERKRKMNAYLKFLTFYNCITSIHVMICFTVLSFLHRHFHCFFFFFFQNFHSTHVHCTWASTMAWLISFYFFLWFVCVLCHRGRNCSTEKRRKKTHSRFHIKSSKDT